MTDPENIAELEELLPFYVNGTLPAAQIEQIDTALAISPRLRARLEQEQQLAGMIKQGGARIASALSSTDERLAELTRQEDIGRDGIGREGSAENVRQPLTTTTGPAPRLPGLMAMLNPRNWHPAVSLAIALALIAQTAVILTDRDGSIYRTASGDDPVQPADNSWRLVVRLKPEARWDNVEALLYGVGLKIVSGPDEGRLLVEVIDPETSDIKVARERLRDAPEVDFADFVR